VYSLSWNNYTFESGKTGEPTMGGSHVGQFAALCTAVSWTVGAALFEQTTRRAGTFVVNLVKVTLALLFLSIFLWVAKGSPSSLSFQRCSFSGRE
jgi:hypothetical protein